MENDREKAIKNIPTAFNFIIELYKEVVNLFGEVESFLKKHEFPAAGELGIVESVSKALNSPDKWLIWHPERYFLNKNNDTLICIKCMLYDEERQLEKPCVIAGVYRFKKPVERKLKLLSEWNNILLNDLKTDFDIVNEKNGVSTTQLKNQEKILKAWKGYELHYLKFFEVPLIELTDSKAIKEKICDKLIKIL